MREKTPRGKDAKPAARKSMEQQGGPDVILEGQRRLAAITEKKPKRGRPRGGFKKEKTQISVRVDQAIMDLAYELIEKSNGRLRITGLLERGLILAMREEKQLIPLARQVRFLVNEIITTRTLNRVQRLVVFEMLPLGLQLDDHWKSTRDFVLATLDAVVDIPGYEEVKEKVAQKVFDQPADEYTQV